MNKRLLPSLLFAATLVLAACAPATATEAPTSSAMPLATESATSAPATTDIPAVTETPVVAATSTAGVPVTGEATVAVSQHPTYGSILANGEGFSLYVFASDVQNSGASACTADCALAWPPLMSQGAPIAGAGVDGTLLSTLTRDDGSMQMTYNGWPLYIFSGDIAPGDATGQGMDGVWFLVTPAGEAVP